MRREREKYRSSSDEKEKAAAAAAVVLRGILVIAIRLKAIRKQQAV